MIWADITKSQLKITSVHSDDKRMYSYRQADTLSFIFQDFWANLAKVKTTDFCLNWSYYQLLFNNLDNREINTSSENLNFVF